MADKEIPKSENFKITWSEQRDRMYSKITKWRMNANKNPDTRDRKISLLDTLERKIKEFDNSNPTDLMKPCIVDYYDYYFGKKAGADEGASNISPQVELTESQLEMIKEFQWPLK